MKDRVLRAERSSFETVTNANPLEIIPPTGVISMLIFQIRGVNIVENNLLLMIM